MGPVILSARRWNPELGVYEDSAVIDRSERVTGRGVSVPKMAGSVSGGNKGGPKTEKQAPNPAKKSGGGPGQQQSAVVSPTSAPAGFAWSSFQDSPAPISLPSLKEVTSSWDTDGPLSPPPVAVSLPNARGGGVQKTPIQQQHQIPLLMPSQGATRPSGGGTLTLAADVGPKSSLPGDGRRAVSLGALFGPGITRSNGVMADPQIKETHSLPSTPIGGGAVPNYSLGAAKPLLISQAPFYSRLPKQELPQSVNPGPPLRPNIKDFPLLGGAPTPLIQSPQPPQQTMPMQEKVVPKILIPPTEPSPAASPPLATASTAPAPPKRSSLVPSSAMRRKV